MVVGSPGELIELSFVAPVAQQGQAARTAAQAGIVGRSELNVVTHVATLPDSGSAWITCSVNCEVHLDPPSGLRL